MLFVSAAVAAANVVLQHRWKQNNKTTKQKKNTACTLWNIVYAVALSVLEFGCDAG